MKLSVVIVSYNVKYYLEQCLFSLQRALSTIDSEVIVVDNHSKDGSCEYLREKFSDVQFIASRHNLGFARANNLAIKKCKGKYVLLLNPDTVVGEDTLIHAVDFMDKHADAGAVGVEMLHVDGTVAMESRRGIPSPMTAFYKMIGLCNRFPRSKRFGKYYMSYLPWDKPCEIEIVSGAFCLLRKEALDKVGLLDEDFFMYGEDIDLSYRILKGGYHNYYIPEQILHYKGESTEKSSFRYVHVFYGAMFIFFKKHFSAMNLLFSIPIKLAIYVKAFWATISMLSQNLNRSLGFVSSKKVPSDTLEEFLVCDTQNMEYREILKQLANSDHKRPIAFLYKDKKMVITPSDVIFDDL
jgi:GT2 family glycosyltransferase